MSLVTHSSSGTEAEEAEEPSGALIEFWLELSPLAQAVFLRTHSKPRQVARVEHVIMALLDADEPDDESAHWLEAYEPQNRAAAIDEARKAVQRSQSLLARLNVDASALSSQITGIAQLEPLQTHGEGIAISHDFKRVWAMAGEEAQRMNSPLIWPEHIVLAILQWSRPRAWWNVWPLQRDRAAQVLAPLKIDLDVAHVVARELLSGEVEVILPWTIRVQKAVDAAHQLVIKTHCGRISPPHLLLALLRDDEDAREMLKYLQLEDVDLVNLRESLRSSIKSDGEASTAQIRFSKDAARVLDKCKSMSTRAGFKRIDEAGLLLSLALHSGESAEAWRQVLGEKKARTLVQRLYRPTRERQTMQEPEGWGWPHGAANWVAFLTAPLCWPLGFGLMTGVPHSGPLFGLVLTLVFIPMAWMVASIFALLLGRPAAFKQICESFLSGFSLLMMLYMGGSVIWSIIRALLRM